ncbi:Nif3-like dinuclear metal center hexameric protein [Kingella kingae]|uniref:Nif3-like dinuclear metal center hexameric protein n=1 Tax=Kingella kingae TaxID=504 RepID=UPI00042A3C10|nr:Nif3-like dinuclear metal center hexameric protein [Kingella kingae]MDK4574666.1 Nif3-like dinuclear metal center hexameric protein [Kingella kingae]MDK4606811.1 Nif3-like dinuclear metal center hexameric protein [Kingella kingae]
MTTRHDILTWCDQTLCTTQFKDYTPNGLQVEGAEQISHIVTAVTASRAAIDHAAQVGAQMLLVHHGMFWKSEPTAIIGWKKQRIATLLRHDINMVGYHLPLDAHPQLGNNAQLAQKLGWTLDTQFGEQNLLNIGTLPAEQNTLPKLLAHMEHVLGRKPIVAGDTQSSLHRIAWCTGGAQGYFQQAIDAGAQVYVTGEISEAQFHLANETGAVFIAAGHHATERYGVQALGNALAAEFNLRVDFFDENNPA